jgi:hypothetical protein
MIARIVPTAPRLKQDVLDRGWRTYAVFDWTRGVADGAHAAAEA